MIIDSVNTQCDNCGAIANHHIMFNPDGWLISTEKQLCPNCHDRTIEPNQPVEFASDGYMNEEEKQLWIDYARTISS